METGLAGKRVLVTGASGGIGGACVRAFAAEGAAVVGQSFRHRERADGLPLELLLDADLTDEAAVDSLFAAAGPLDVCAAVAGVWPGEDVPVWELPLERWRKTLDANLTATFLTARGFLRQLGDREGALVLVGSTAGLFGEAGHADYAAAKSAILGGLLLSLKNEVVRRHPGARVNAVAPGWTASPTRADVQDPELVARVTRTMALRKVGRPEDVAAQIVALASPIVSGHVDGPGRHRRRRHGGPGRPRLSRPCQGSDPLTVDTTETPAQRDSCDEPSTTRTGRGQTPSQSGSRSAAGVPIAGVNSSNAGD